MLIPTRALENQVFVACANCVGREGSSAYCGLSTIAASDSTVLAQVGAEERLLLADLELIEQQER